MYRVLSLFILVSLWLCNVAATYYVTPTGRGAKDGSAWSAASAFATWEEGFANGNQSPGDFYFIAGDTSYVSASDISDTGDGSSNSLITIAGVSPEFTSGSWEQYVASGTSRPYIYLGDMQYNFGDYHQIYGLALEGSNVYPFLTNRNCLVSGMSVYNTSDVANRYGMHPSENTIIDHCEVSSVNGYGIRLYAYSAALFNYIRFSKIGILPDAQANLIFGNVIKECSTAGIYTTLFSIFVLNNTIDDCETGLQYDGDDSGYVFINNIFSNSGSWGISGEAGKLHNPWYMDFNNFYNNLGDYTNSLAGYNDTSYNPQYQDAANADYAPDQESGVTVSALSMVTPYGVGRPRWR